MHSQRMHYLQGQRCAAAQLGTGCLHPLISLAHLLLTVERRWQLHGRALPAGALPPLKPAEAHSACVTQGLGACRNAVVHTQQQTFSHACRPMLTQILALIRAVVAQKSCATSSPVGPCRHCGVSVAPHSTQRFLPAGCCAHGMAWRAQSGWLQTAHAFTC